MSADFGGLGALDAERAALTLPGAIPGLVQMGSRVVRLDGIGGPPLRAHIGGPLLPSYTVAEVFGDYLWIARVRECLGCEAGEVAMDLTDATSRAHLKRWLARQIRHIHGGHLDPSEGARWHRSHRGYWELHCQRADEHRRWQEVDFVAWDGNAEDSDRVGGPHATWTRFVPALADIDPNDPRLLPDGSRLVDAEALRRVCLHVAGLEVTP